eukprot:6188432-Pleurochrysis_carterae.AAC.2
MSLLLWPCLAARGSHRLCVAIVSGRRPPRRLLKSYLSCSQSPRLKEAGGFTVLGLSLSAWGP